MLPPINRTKVVSVKTTSFKLLLGLSVCSGLTLTGCTTTPLTPNQAALKAVQSVYHQPNYQVFSSSKIAAIDLSENKQEKRKIALVPAPQDTPDAVLADSAQSTVDQTDYANETQPRKKEKDTKFLRIATDLMKQLMLRQSVEAVTTVDALKRQVEIKPAVRYESKNASSFLTVPMLLDFKTSQVYADLSALSPLLTNSKYDNQYVGFDISQWTQKVDLEKLYAYSKNIQADTVTGIKPEAFTDITVPESASSKGVKRMVALHTSLDDYFASSASATEKRKPDLLLALKYQQPKATADAAESVTGETKAKSAEDVVNSVLDAYAQKDYSKQVSEMIKGFIDPSSSIQINYGLDGKGALVTQDTTYNVVLKNNLPLKGSVTLVSQATIDNSAKARIGFVPTAANVVSFSEASKDTLFGELMNTAAASYSGYLKKAEGKDDKTDSVGEASAAATVAEVEAEAAATAAWAAMGSEEFDWCKVAKQKDIGAEDRAFAKKVCDADKAVQKPAVKKTRGGKKHR